MKKYLGIAITATLLVMTIYLVIWNRPFNRRYKWAEWTGFGESVSTKTSKETRLANGNTTAVETITTETQHAKTLWDWLDLLIIPLALAGGAYWLNRAEKRREIEVEEQRAQESSLQAYLDQMTTLLLGENLRESKQDDEVRSVARARTLTVLRKLDGERKAIVIRFLYESNLINERRSFVSLANADLQGVLLAPGTNLSRINLSGANMQRVELNDIGLGEADLSEADLSYAKFTKVNFKGANLRKAILKSATFSSCDFSSFFSDPPEDGADLSEAKLEGANLYAESLKGVIFKSAKLMNSDLTCAFLQYTDLEGADLSSAKLLNARFNDKTNIKRTNLKNANLHNARDATQNEKSKGVPRPPVLSRDFLKEAKLDNTTMPDGTVSSANLK